MRKIKGFKLNCRVKDIQRRAKKAGVDLAAMGFVEPARAREASPTPLFESYLNGAAAAFSPAVLFDSFAHPDPAETALLSPIPGLAYSLVLTTLGETFDAFKREQSEKEPAKLGLLVAIEEAALEDALRLATSIIEQEAAEEGCELSPITPLAEGAAVELTLRKLSGAKIGIALSEGKLQPQASRASSLSWLAKSKSKGKAKP